MITKSTVLYCTICTANHITFIKTSPYLLSPAVKKELITFPQRGSKGLNTYKVYFAFHFKNSVTN